MSKDRCSSCGILFSQHLGIAGTCREAGEYQATIKRIVEWAKGKCECCGNQAIDGDCVSDDGKGSPCLNWAPPKAWGLE